MGTSKPVSFLSSEMVGSMVGMDDMCMLTNLTQETLLENTERRFKANIIYVCIIYYIIYKHRRVFGE